MNDRFSRNLFRLITGWHAAAPRRRQRSAFYRGPARNSAYKAWIRSLPCAACGRAPRSEAAHVGRDGGKGLKSSDYSTIPLCFSCHRTGKHSYHAGKQSFSAYWCINLDALVERYNAVWRRAHGK